MMKKTIYLPLALSLLAGMTACNDDYSEPKMEEAVLISEININTGDEIKLAKGMTVAPQYSVVPENAMNTELTFTSSAPEIASVDAQGAIAAHEIGQTYVSITPRLTFDVMKSLTVSVVPVATAIEAHDIEMYSGTSADLSLPEYVSVTPADGYNYFDGTSSDENVAKVEDGKLYALKAGKATIVVTTKDGSNLTSTAEVVVKEAIMPESIEITGPKEMAVDETTPIQINVSPSNATTALIEWSSSNPSVVTVDEDGNLTALDYGEAQIEGRTESGVTATATVTVVKGLINDYGSGLSIFNVGQNATAAVSGGVMTVSFANGQKRGDLTRKKGVWLNADRYPIMAIKTSCDTPGKLWHNYDFNAGTNPQNYGGFNMVWTNVINTPDGGRVYYADISKQCTASNGYFMSGEKWAANFTIKTGTDGTDRGYALHWFKTFKSMDELKEFIENEN